MPNPLNPMYTIEIQVLDDLSNEVFSAVLQTPRNDLIESPFTVPGLLDIAAAIENTPGAARERRELLESSSDDPKVTL